MAPPQQWPAPRAKEGLGPPRLAPERNHPLDQVSRTASSQQVKVPGPHDYPNPTLLPLNSPSWGQRPATQWAVTSWLALPFSSPAHLPWLPPSALEHKRGQRAQERLSLTNMNILVLWPHLPGTVDPGADPHLQSRPPTGSSANTPTTPPLPGSGNSTLHSSAAGSSLFCSMSTFR